MEFHRKINQNKFLQTIPENKYSQPIYIMLTHKTRNQIIIYGLYIYVVRDGQSKLISNYYYQNQYFILYNPIIKINYCYYLIFNHNIYNH